MTCTNNPTVTNYRCRISAPPSAARRTLGVTDGPAVYAGHGPAALLRPERKVVAFTGRAGELDELQQWCASDLARSVRALTGAGGVGKTRLAREVAARCAACGGQWRLVTAGDEAGAVADARAAHSGRLLLIVD